jgi:hypothetical protein
VLGAVRFRRTSLIAKRGSGGNSVRLFEDTIGAFARAHYGTLAIVDRLGAVFVWFILPLLIVRHILVCSWCDRSFMLHKIPAFNVILAQDASMIRGLCLVEIFFGLYILFRIIFCSACHQQIMDEQINRYRKRGKAPIKQVTKLIMIIFGVVVVGLSEMVIATPNSIRILGLERAEMGLIFLLCCIVT